MDFGIFQLPFFSYVRIFFQSEALLSARDGT